MNDLWVTYYGRVLHHGRQGFTLCGQSLKRKGWRRPTAEQIRDFVECKRCVAVLAEA